MPCVVSRTGFGGELGYELFCRPEHAADLWDVVVSQMNARPYGVGIVETLRVEAGLVVLDYDYEADERTPYDLSFDAMVALGKVDFLGREALKNGRRRPPRRFKTLGIEGEELPEYGAEVTRDGEPVGTLTSPAMSPRFGLLGLAVLDTGGGRRRRIGRCRPRRRRGAGDGGSTRHLRPGEASAAVIG